MSTDTATIERHAKFHNELRTGRGPVIVPYDEIDEDVRRKVSMAQIIMSQKFSFEAALVAPMKLLFVRDDDPVIETAATECWRTIWINPAFIRKLDTKATMMVLAHEAHHALSLDGVRRGNRNPMVWNWACDLRINGILKQRGFDFSMFPVRSNLAELCAEIDAQAQGMPPTDHGDKLSCLLDESIGTSRTTESVYDEIMSHMPQCGSGAGEGEPSVGNSIGGDVRPDLPSAGGSPGSGSGDDDAPGTGGGQEVDSRPISATEMQQEMQQRAARGALTEQARAKQQGTHVDAFVRRFVDDILQEQVSWPILLRRLMRKATAREDYSMRRPSRRGLSRGVITASLRSEALNKICAVCDTSGSVSNAELQAQAAEVAAVVREAKAKSTEVAFVDTAVRNTQSFRRGERIKFKPKGGGGTDFRPGVAWAEQQKPDVLIYFTDGYGSFPKTPPNFPVIWVLTGSHTIGKGRVPWGMVLEID